MVRFLVSILIQLSLLGTCVASDKTSEPTEPRRAVNQLVPQVLANCMKDICDNIDHLNPERTYAILVEAINVLQENKIQCFMRFLKVSGFKYDSLYDDVTWRSLKIEDPYIYTGSKTPMDSNTIEQHLSKSKVSKEQTILLLRDVIEGIIADRILFAQLSRDTPQLWVDQKSYDIKEDHLIKTMELNYRTLGAAVSEVMRKQIKTWNDINTCIDDLEIKQKEQNEESLKYELNSRCEQACKLTLKPGKEIWKEWVSRYVLKRAWLLQDFIDQGLANNPQALEKYTDITKAIEGLRPQQIFEGELSDLFEDPVLAGLVPDMDVLLAHDTAIHQPTRQMPVLIGIQKQIRNPAQTRLDERKAKMRESYNKQQEEKKVGPTPPQQPAPAPTSKKKKKKKNNKKSPVATQSNPSEAPVVEMTKQPIEEAATAPPVDAPPRLAPMEAKKPTAPLLKDVMNLLLPKFSEETKELLIEPAGKLSKEALLERTTRGLVAAISEARAAKEELFQATMSRLGVDVLLSSEASYSVTMFTDQERELLAQDIRFTAAFSYTQDDTALVLMELCFRNPAGFDMLSRTRDAALGDRFFYDLLTHLLPHMDFKKIDFKGMSTDFRTVEKSFMEMYNRFVYMFFPILREDLTQQGLLAVRERIEKYLMKPPVYYLQCLGEANVSLVPKVQPGFCRYMYALKCIMGQVIDHKFPVVLNSKLEQRVYQVAGKEFIVTPDQLERMKMDLSRDIMVGRLADRKRTDEIIQWYEDQHSQDLVKCIELEADKKKGQADTIALIDKYEGKFKELYSLSQAQQLKDSQQAESLMKQLGEAQHTSAQHLTDLNVVKEEKQAATLERDQALLEVQRLRDELALFKSLEAQRMVDYNKRNQCLEEQTLQQAKMNADLREKLAAIEGVRDQLLKRTEALTEENDILNDRVAFHQLAATINENAEEALQEEMQRANKLEASLTSVQDENERLKKEAAEQANKLEEAQKQLAEARKQLEEIQSSDGMQVIRNQNMLINGLMQQMQFMEQYPDQALRGKYGFVTGHGQIRYLTIADMFQVMREGAYTYNGEDEEKKPEAITQNSNNEK